MQDFDQLIHPVPREEFFSHYWEKNPLYVPRADQTYYAPLITPGDLDDLISSGQLRYPALQLAKEGYYLPPEAYTATVRSGGEQFTGVVLLDRVNAQYRAGATVSLPAVQRASSKLGAFTTSLEQDLEHAVQANAYLTAAGTPGFKPHYDTHDIFVMQIGGRKRWKIYRPPIELPYRTQIFNPQTYVPPKTPVADIMLNRGDLLYLPRGYVHTTGTSADSYSVHITLAVTVYTWIDLAIEYLQGARAMPEFRKALPCGFSRNQTDAQLARTVLDLLDGLARNAQDKAFVRRFLAQAEARRTKPGEAFRSDASVQDRQAPA